MWKEALHFPEIKPKKPRTIKQETKLFAITSEDWKKQQAEKMKKEERENSLKELRKFKKEIEQKLKKKSKRK